MRWHTDIQIYIHKSTITLLMIIRLFEAWILIPSWKKRDVQVTTKERFLRCKPDRLIAIYRKSNEHDFAEKERN